MVDNEMTTDDLFEDGPEGIQETGDDGVVQNVNTDDDPIEDPVDNGTGGDDDDEPTGDNAPQGGEEDDEPLSGIEKYLADYGIIGGQIQFEDGEFKSFEELSSEEQYNILQSLASEARPTIEDDYDLDETEINLLNDIRNSELSVEEYIGELINEQVRRSLTARDSLSIDYENMPDDAVYMKWLTEVNPDVSEEEAVEFIETQRANEELYKHLVDQIRGKYIQEQRDEYLRNLNAQTQQQKELIEADRYQIVQTVENIDNIGGAEINDDMKNEVLHSLLEINDQGDPLIMEEMFSDPEKLFKAAWFMKYGESYLDNVDKYWKRRESEAYKRGKMDILEGAPSSNRGMARNNVIPKPGKSTAGNSGTESRRTDSIDALWDD